MPDQGTQVPGIRPDLEELCRIHDIGLDLIDRSDDIDDLLDRVLDEYELRLADLRDDTLDADPEDEGEAKKLRALVMFATQAAALKQKADAADEQRKRAEELERLNEQIKRGHDRERRMHEQQVEDRYRAERLALVMKTLSVLSHKINNPLTTLLGRAQMLKVPGTDPKITKAADAIEQSSKRIAAYVAELALAVKEGREESLDRLLDIERPEI
jgi:signal transduction histidine kinase